MATEPQSDVQPSQQETLPNNEEPKDESQSPLTLQQAVAPTVLPSNFGRLCGDGLIRTYLQYTKNQASPPLFHVWTIVSVIAGILRRNVYINRGGYYTLYPNFYIVLIAPTGRGKKSTAATMGVRLMRNVDGLRIMHEKITPEGLIHYMKGDMDRKEPGSNALNIIMKGKNAHVRMDCNCFVFAPELSVFLGNVSYANGLIELLTSLYEGKDKWEYRTKTSGFAELFNVNVNLFGASNPEWLAKGLQEDAFGGGFMGRTIYIFQDQGKKIAWPERPEGMEELEMRIVHDLIEISKLNGEYSIEPKAKIHYQEWHDAYNPDFSGRMSGYHERKPDHILKLSMVLAASQSNNLIITKEHITTAIKMLDEVESLMPKAFAYIGATNEARISQHILELIAGSDKHFISYKRLLSGTRHMIKNRREFNDILDTLESAGALKIFHTSSGQYLTVDAEIDRFREAAELAAHKDAISAFEQEKQIDLQKVSEEPQRPKLEEAAAKLKEALDNIAEG